MSQPAAPAKKGLSGRAIGGIVIAAAVLIFIFTNWQSVEVNFLFLSPTMPLAIALAIAAAGGFIAGFLIGRNRYKK
jgi:uncharacterized integral membrane protein